MEKWSVKERDRNVLRIILIEGLANFVVLTIKLIVGIGTGSLAVLSDAAHSFTDLVNNSVAWFVTRHSVKPADAKHPYGHRKFETVAVFSLASLLVILAFELALRAITSEHSDVTTSHFELGLMLVALVTNITISTWQRWWAKRLNSDILLADANHTLSDVLITASVIAGWQLSAHGWEWVDRLCTLAVVALILYLAFGLFKKALPVLVDERAIDPNALRSALIKVNGVTAISRVRSRWVGPLPAVDLVVEVDGRLSTRAAHKIADQLEATLEARFNVQDISIHIEPSNE